MGKELKSPLWFHSQRFVWGWYPMTWQGWVILSLYLIFLLYGSWVLLPHDRLQNFDPQRILVWLIFVAACIGSLMLIVWRTGGRPSKEHDVQKTN